MFTCTPERPSAALQAPPPPAMTSWKINTLSVPMLPSPARIVVVQAPLPAVTTRSGNTEESAPKMASGILCWQSICAPMGLGSVGFTMLPSGAMIFTARLMPSFAGISSPIRAFTAKKTAAFVQGHGTLMGALICCAVPVKSKVRSSPAMVTFTLIGSGSGYLSPQPST